MYFQNFRPIPESSESPASLQRCYIALGARSLKLTDQPSRRKTSRVFIKRGQRHTFIPFLDTFVVTCGGDEASTDVLHVYLPQKGCHSSLTLSAHVVMSASLSHLFSASTKCVSAAYTARRAFHDANIYASRRTAALYRVKNPIRFPLTPRPCCLN